MSTPELELDADAGLKPAAEAGDRSSGPVPGKLLRVLLVEDSPDDALLLERHLRRNGFVSRISRIETAEEMRLEMASATPPELVLADYNLPNFSGPEALRILKASGVDLPFIMMSGAVSEETAVESMRAGAQDYVTKQNLTRLVPAIERELKEAAARRNRRAAEQALQASEARFHTLVEAMPLGLLIGEASGRIVYANGAVERMLGYSADAVLVGTLADVGAVTLDAICPALSHIVLKAFQGDVTEREPFEAVCVTAEGQQIDVLIGIALLNPNEPAEARQVAAFIADLTMQKKSEEVLRRTEKLAVAGRLAASIAHEINNPLEAITNCLYLIARGEMDPESRSYLTMAQKELDRVSKITMQTLRFYRSSTRPLATDLHELLETVLALLEQRFNQGAIEVMRCFRETPPVVAHNGEIRQVLANLVGNAIDALPPGGRLVLKTSSARNWQTGVAGVRVTVADNGSGMDAALLARIFEPFFSTKGITGTGLGLWISREIVERHNGHLRVRSRKATESAPGQTVFAVFLPMGGVEP